MAKKVYILSDEMRASKSGFYVEGTDIEMDYPDNYPLPMETEVIENDIPVSLRILPNCGYLEKEKQRKEGYPETYKYTDADRKKLTFHHARLILDEKKDRMWIEYVERAGWFEGNEKAKARQNTRTIYKLYDEDALIDKELEHEELITRAKSKVLGLEVAELKDLYRLSVGGNYNDALISIKMMRRHLMSIAEGNPEFVMEGINTTRDRLVVLLNKAVSYKILTFDIPGQVSYKSEASSEWVNIISISEAQGSVNKFNKFLDYLMTDMGQTELSIIENKVNELDEEQGIGTAQRKEEMFVHEGDAKTKRVKR